MNEGEIQWLPAFVLASMLGFSAPTTAQTGQPEVTHAVSSARQAVVARHFMVAAANRHAAAAGYSVLKNGGTAMDAAVAVQMVLNLVEPQSSGIGGGAFLLYWDAKAGTLQAFDGRETAPAAATPDYFLMPDGRPKGFWQALVGGGSVGVPGTVKLLDIAHRLHGTRPWAALLQPAIELAEAGFAISPRLAASIARNSGPKRRLAEFAATRAYFFEADGTPREAGSILRNPEFANTLRMLAEKGADGFYRGPIARDIVAAVKATPGNPGIMTLRDLADYRVKIRRPVCLPYREYRVCGMGPPSSGGLTVGQMLGLLNGFDLASMGPGAQAVHLFAQAAKLAYADRAMYMADADYVTVPVAGLLDENYLSSRAQWIQTGPTSGKAEAGVPPLSAAARWAEDGQVERPGTSHFVIRDRYGNALTMTTTIETGFGSRIMVRGFLLNNELTDFSRSPAKGGRAVANRVQGGKRPRSSMAPTVVFAKGQPVLLLGSPGGSRIINYVAQAIIAILDWGMDPQKAVSMGHFVNRNGGTELEEGTTAAALAPELRRRGHEVSIRDLNSGIHAISIRAHELVGGADPRREGIALGD